jgi:hypothetical protein
MGRDRAAFVRLGNHLLAIRDKRLFGFHGGVRVSSSVQLGRPA